MQRATSSCLCLLAKPNLEIQCHCQQTKSTSSDPNTTRLGNLASSTPVFLLFLHKPHQHPTTTPTSITASNLLTERTFQAIASSSSLFLLLPPSMPSCPRALLAVQQNQQINSTTTIPQSRLQQSTPNTPNVMQGSPNSDKSYLPSTSSASIPFPLQNSPWVASSGHIIPGGAVGSAHPL